MKAVYVDVTHEAEWVVRTDNTIAVYHAGKPALVQNGYRVSGVKGQPGTFKVEKKVST